MMNSILGTNTGNSDTASSFSLWIDDRDIGHYIGMCTRVADGVALEATVKGLQLQTSAHREETSPYK